MPGLSGRMHKLALKIVKYYLTTTTTTTLDTANTMDNTNTNTISPIFIQDPYF